MLLAVQLCESAFGLHATGVQCCRFITAQEPVKNFRLQLRQYRLLMDGGRGALLQEVQPPRAGSGMPAIRHDRAQLLKCSDGIGTITKQGEQPPRIVGLLAPDWIRTMFNPFVLFLGQRLKNS